MKNALLIVIAFVLGGAAVWYFAGSRGPADAGAQAGASGRPGAGRPGAGGPGGGFAQAAPLVTVARVRQDQVFDSVEALGTAQANESVTINAKVTDTVRKVNFSDGDYVDAGAVLAELTNQEVERVIAEVMTWTANREALSRQAV